MAKKKYDKIPRKKKKQLKQKLGITGNISRSQLLKLEEKEREREQRAKAQARRYKQNIEYLESLGIPTNIITKTTSIKETERRARAYLADQASSARKKQQAHLYAKKVNRLIDAGFTPDEAYQIVGTLWKQKNNKEIDKIIENKKPFNDSIRVTGSSYLYIGFAEKVSGFKMFDLSGKSNEELIDYINDRIRESDMNIDGYDVFTGIFKFDVFDSKQDALDQAEHWYERGYNLNFKHKQMKLDSDRYDKITISNSFNYREFLEMTYTCMAQMLNWQVLDFRKTLSDFDMENGTSFTKDMIKPKK